MVGKLIFRGFIIGILAGLLAFGWAKMFGEAPVTAAVSFESEQNEAKEAAALAAGKKPVAEDPEIFSRSVQSGIGLLTGVVVVGAGLGCLFAVLFAFANGRMGRLGPIGAAGFPRAHVGLCRAGSQISCESTLDRRTGHHQVPDRLVFPDAGNLAGLDLERMDFGEAPGAQVRVVEWLDDGRWGLPRGYRHFLFPPPRSQ
jgi:hypothetical protein